MTKLHGTSRSRSARSLWALEELGVNYEHNPMPTTDAKSAAHLKLNPNGHVPVLEDDGVVLWESMAINLYLADKYGKNSLWPSDAAGRAAAYQWSFWAMTEVEPHLITILRNRVMNAPDQRDEKAASAAVEALKAPLNALEERAQGQGIPARQNFYDCRPQCGRRDELDSDDEARLVVNAQRSGVAAEMSRARSEQESARAEVVGGRLKRGSDHGSVVRLSRHRAGRDWPRTNVCDAAVGHGRRRIANRSHGRRRFGHRDGSEIQLYSIAGAAPSRSISKSPKRSKPC